ncbi:uncharacterized protein L969DRAFT_52072 [Mixia osmundae IAM 14324]|uniref:COP9 signalosome complex subunit 4 n=1 Tax=Mixia osmundae (strain CBS 9802 / IAM 14324 / JCM 22182 / KY 12970) TaxID=764103 RepID=G7DWU3_MIXOS|nr:uncharacterized protein L969DRAFT_55516 [Mixia osmundae IAM 14324]XP_014566714.1 uncharacterized protein L969DRAFT_52072 [Mixia osmundae IAM 14324]KEI36183.1 hypothetical protein L969DRAFT_55516 [Mixia osmundae IAM 14324]KEI38151.1 hypothetical protein L969DRAFT_52072 [Mixia osmundae IAM 14324]GAA95040.1 hypothetical protein E5Q_01695 [Mixia osmundae IAM 14324]
MPLNAVRSSKLHQLAGLREKLARVLEEEEDWSSAAKALLSISVDTGKRATDEYKLQLYMRAVRLFLEDDDSVSAEGPFNRASLIIHTSTDIATQLSYRLCQARILDSQRKFNEATTKYHNLSFAVEIDEEERLIFLQQAITCAILAPAGPIRSRALSSLFRDERSAQTPFYAVLSKMFLDQMIPESEVTAFAASLKPHQLAKLPPSSVVIPETDEDRAAPSTARRAPMNVLDRAIMEHNLLSASKLYLNITCTGLGLLLSLTPSAAEVLARTMVQQGRLSATINQVSGLIEFEVKPKEVEAAVSNVGIAAAATDRQEDQVHAPATVQWDMRIRQANQMTEDIAMRIAQLHPVLA